jgi:hypothetical protein
MGISKKGHKNIGRLGPSIASSFQWNFLKVMFLYNRVKMKNIAKVATWSVSVRCAANHVKIPHNNPEIK